MGRLRLAGCRDVMKTLRELEMPFVGCGVAKGFCFALAPVFKLSRYAAKGFSSCVRGTAGTAFFIWKKFCTV